MDTGRLTAHCVGVSSEKKLAQKWTVNGFWTVKGWTVNGVPCVYVVYIFECISQK